LTSSSPSHQYQPMYTIDRAKQPTPTESSSSRANTGGATAPSVTAASDTSSQYVPISSIPAKGTPLKRL
jgi:hypothetical protein